MRRLWKVGSHFSPLAVVGNKVYLLEDDPSRNLDHPGRLRVNAFDLRSGNLLSKRTYNLNPAAVVDDLSMHPHPWDDGRVLVYKNMLYVEAKRLGTAQANVARFALDGRGTPRPNFVKPGANLEWLAGPYRGKLFLLEHKHGKRRFLVGQLEGSSLTPTRFDDTYPIGATPISRLDLIGNGLYVGRADGWFYAVDVRTGKALFCVQTGAESFGPTRVLGDTLIVQAGNNLLAFALPETLKP